MRFIHGYKHLGPGLHRVGPNPWDFVYNPAKGERLSVEMANGKLFTGTITDFTEDEETGEISPTLA